MTRQVTDDLYVDLDYFEPEDYYVYVAQAAADMAVTVSMTAALSELAQVPRQDTDDLYVDLDYYQPEDYYVYVAQANSEQNAVSSLTVAPEATITSTAVLSSAFAVTAQSQRVSRNIQTAEFVGGAWTNLELDTDLKQFGAASLEIPQSISPISANDDRVFFTGSAFKIIETGITWTSINGLDWTKASNNLTITDVNSATPNALNNIVFEDNQFLIKQGSTIAFADIQGTNFSTTTLADTSVFGGVGFVYQNKINFFNGNYYVPYRELRSPSTLDPIGFFRSASLTNPSWSDAGEIVSINELVGGGIVANTIASSGSLFAMQIRASNLSETRIFRSSNGSNWTAAAAPTTDDISLKFLDNQFIAYSTSNIYSSTDLISWTNQNVSLLGLIQGVYYLGSKWIVITSAGVYSGSALNNAQLTLTLTKDFNESHVYYPAFGSGKYIIPSNDLVYYSDDAVEWQGNELAGVSDLPGYIEYVGNVDTELFNSIDFWIHNDTTKSGISTVFTKISELKVFRIDLVNNDVFVRVNDGTGFRTLRLGANFLSSGWNHVRFVQNGSNASLYSGGSRRDTSTNWVNFASDTFYIAGRDANKLYYLDEFLITDEILTPTASTSYIVPNQPWQNSDSVDALLHFDTDFEDDSVTSLRIASAVLPTVATVSALSDITLGTNVSLLSEFTQTADATLVIDLDPSGYDAEFTINVDNTRVLEFDVNLDVVATKLVAAARVSNLLIDIQSAASMSVNAEVIVDNLALLTTTFLQITDADRIRDTGFQGADAEFTLTAQTDVVKDAESNLNAVFLQITDADRIRDTGFETADAEFTLTAQTDVVKDAESNLNVNTALSAAAIKNVTADILMAAIVSTITVIAKFAGNQIQAQSTFALTVSGEIVKDSVINMQANFAQNTVNQRIRDTGFETADAEFTQSVTPVKIARANSSMFSTVDLDTDFIRTRNFSASKFSEFTVTAFAIKEGESLALMNSEFTLLANFVRTRNVTVNFEAIASKLSVGSKITVNTVLIQSQSSLTVDLSKFQLITLLTHKIRNENRLSMIRKEQRSSSIY